jgi:hypothetical protein
MTATRTTMIALVLTIGTAACTVAQAQVEVSDLCIPYSGVDISGVAPGTTVVDHSFTYDKLAAIQSLASSVSNLEFVSIGATAASGIPNLSFIQSAHVTIASGDPTSSLPTLDVYDCTADCVPDGDTLSVPATLQLSALAYVESGSVVADLEIGGQLPVDAWTINVDVCFSGELNYHENL